MVGQHCFAEHIGTAGGAYQTGKWAAEEVISLCKNQKEEKGSEKLVEKEEKKATKIWK